MHVKFKQNHAPYVTGDVAPFEVEAAEKLVELDVAEKTEVAEATDSEEVVTNVANKPGKGKAKASDK